MTDKTQLIVLDNSFDEKCGLNTGCYSYINWKNNRNKKKITFWDYSLLNNKEFWKKKDWEDFDLELGKILNLIFRINRIAPKSRDKKRNRESQILDLQSYYLYQLELFEQTINEYFLPEEKRKVLQNYDQKAQQIIKNLAQQNTNSKVFDFSYILAINSALDKSDLNIKNVKVVKLLPTKYKIKLGLNKIKNNFYFNKLKLPFYRTFRIAMDNVPRELPKEIGRIDFCCNSIKVEYYSIFSMLLKKYDIPFSDVNICFNYNNEFYKNNTIKIISNINNFINFYAKNNFKYNQTDLFYRLIIEGKISINVI